MGADREKTKKIPVWLDCDPGHDDAFAILLAAYHPSIHLLAVSTVYGNAPLHNTTQNALSVIQAIGKASSVHVHQGVSHPFCRQIEHSPEIHGESGLDGTDLLPVPIRNALTCCNTIKDMRDALMSCPPDTAWLVATGSLTNVGLLFATFPEVARHIAGLSIMGGAVGDDFVPSITMGPDFVDSMTGKLRSRVGNKTPWAEFNIWCDPEASQSVFRNPDLMGKTTLITLDLTHTACASSEVRDMLLHGRKESTSTRESLQPPTRLRRMFNDLLMFFSKTYFDVFGLTEGPPLHDPLAVAAVLHAVQGHDSPVHFDDHAGERWDVQIALEGEEVGRTKVTLLPKGHRGVCIPRSLDLVAFWSTVEECMSRADEATGFVR